MVLLNARSHSTTKYVVGFQIVHIRSKYVEAWRRDTAQLSAAHMLFKLVSSVSLWSLPFYMSSELHLAQVALAQLTQLFYALLHSVQVYRSASSQLQRTEVELLIVPFDIEIGSALCVEFLSLVKRFCVLYCAARSTETWFEDNKIMLGVHTTAPIDALKLQK